MSHFPVMNSARAASVGLHVLRYERLNMCGNMIVGGGQLLRVGNVFPLLVGPGAIPQVWLQVPTDASATSFVLLLEASVPKLPAARVVDTEQGLLVMVNGMEILRIKQQSIDSATVDLLDLRSIGFDIVGDASSLRAGGSTFRGNTFNGVGALIGYEPVSPTHATPVAEPSELERA